ncbi:DUF1573 domain-containing protein [Haloferula sargassicola]
MKTALAFLFSLVALAAAAPAKLTFENTVEKATADLNERQIIVDFPFSNKTDAPVTIERYEASCSCTSVKVKGGKMRYEPGEEGLIRTVFDLGNFVGDTTKGIQLWIEGDPVNQPSVLLQAEIHIPVLVQLEPKTLRWDVNEKPEPKTIGVRMEDDSPIHITEVTCGNESFTTKVKTLEDGKHYEISVKPNSTEKPALAIVNVQTDCKIERHATQRAFAMIRNLPQIPRKQGE